MIKFLLSSLLLMWTASLFAQLDLASLPAIPEELKEGASVVKRQEEVSFEITDISHAKYSVHKVFEVLNEEGRSALEFNESASKYCSLDEAEINMYDESGKLINKVKKKDIYKQADVNDIASEIVYYIHESKPPSYPVIVEYKYVFSFRGTLWYPDYSIMDKGQSVQSSVFTAKVPADLDLRYKEHEIKLPPTVSTEGNYKIYKWSVHDLPAVRYEDNSVSDTYYYPAIFLAPSRFSVYNVEGDMNSWKKFGEWEFELCEGLDALPEDRKDFFKELVKDAPDDKAKIAIIYDYLQKNFRYVSIQLGIGGWKPFPAKFTDDKKYGDCKALSFYTYSVLKAIGIKSYPALINAGRNQLAADPSFPANIFNHMILCVPQKKDTIWLECTSQTCDFNYLSNFTENRNALLVTENGGVLVPTPVSDPLRNRTSNFTTIKLNEDGSGESTTNIYCTGGFRESLNDLTTEKTDDQKEFIVHHIGFKQPDDFHFTKKDNQDYELGLTIEKIPEFKAGSKMFLPLRINHIGSLAMPASEGRTHDYYFDSPKYITDTTVYILPEGYTVDVLPRETEIKNDYVNYYTHYWYDETAHKIYSVLTYCIPRNKIPVAHYAETKRSFDDIASDATQKIVIKKNG